MSIGLASESKGVLIEQSSSVGILFISSNEALMGIGSALMSNWKCDPSPTVDFTLISPYSC
jgi:hypothetical protein